MKSDIETLTILLMRVTAPMQVRSVRRARVALSRLAVLDLAQTSLEQRDRMTHVRNRLLDARDAGVPLSLIVRGSRVDVEALLSRVCVRMREPGAVIAEHIRVARAALS